MRVVLDALIDPRLDAHVEECRLERATSGGVRGPSGPEELRAFRAKQTAAPACAETSAVE